MIEKFKKHPTHLLIGASQTIHQAIIQELHQIWCAISQCSACPILHKISIHQHPNVIWMKPEDTYTKDQFDQLFETLVFKRDEYDLFFFVLEKADNLNQSSANKLLKSLEEPSPGYRFILTTDRPELILPTIYSRCFITTISGDQSESLHPLATLIINATNPATFMEQLEKTLLTHNESFNIAQQILEYFLNKQSNLLSEMHINHLTKLFDHPPMPGSGKYFLRSIYLTVLSAQK